MPTLLLVRHGRTAANTSGVLAGWTPGVSLDETGVRQARSLAEAMAHLPLAAVVTSPLERCRETAQAIADVPGPPTRRQRNGAPRPAPVVDPRIGETRYGDWTGHPLKKLVKDPLWKAVQAHPSSVTFPGEDGEAMVTMAQRAVTAARDHDAEVLARAGDDAFWVAVSHGDVIKAILADALGMHLDSFQRLVADPCSVSVIKYTPLRPFVLRVNGSGADLAGLAQRPRHSRRGRASSDAEVGGGAGPAGDGVPGRSIDATSPVGRT